MPRLPVQPGSRSAWHHPWCRNSGFIGQGSRVQVSGEPWPGRSTLYRLYTQHMHSLKRLPPALTRVIMESDLSNLCMQPSGCNSLLKYYEHIIYPRQTSDCSCNSWSKKFQDLFSLFWVASSLIDIYCLHSPGQGQDWWRCGEWRWLRAVPVINVHFQRASAWRQTHGTRRGLRSPARCHTGQCRVNTRTNETRKYF